MQVVAIGLRKLFYCTSLQLATTRWFRSTIKHFCTVHFLNTAVDKSQQHQGILKKKLETLRIEPWAIRQEARMLSTVLCSFLTLGNLCLWARPPRFRFPWLFNAATFLRVTWDRGKNIPLLIGSTCWITITVPSCLRWRKIFAETTFDHETRNQTEFFFQTLSNRNDSGEVLRFCEKSKSVGLLKKVSAGVWKILKR